MMPSQRERDVNALKNPRRFHIFHLLACHHPLRL
jgi:hypothetical protein